jgi:hypothetical protein
MSADTEGLKELGMPLPDKVQKPNTNTLVETRSLVVGDKFVFGENVWTVLAVKAEGIECQQDRTFFRFDKQSIDQMGEQIVEAYKKLRAQQATDRAGWTPEQKAAAAQKEYQDQLEMLRTPVGQLGKKK